MVRSLTLPMALSSPLVCGWFDLSPHQISPPPLLVHAAPQNQAVDELKSKISPAPTAVSSGLAAAAAAAGGDALGGGDDASVTAGEAAERVVAGESTTSGATPAAPVENGGGGGGDGNEGPAGEVDNPSTEAAAGEEVPK